MNSTPRPLNPKPCELYSPKTPCPPCAALRLPGGPGMAARRELREARGRATHSRGFWGLRVSGSGFRAWAYNPQTMIAGSHML